MPASRTTSSSNSGMPMTRGRDRDWQGIQCSNSVRRSVCSLSVIGLAAVISFICAGCDVASHDDEHLEHHHSHDERRATFAESVAEIQWRSDRFKSSQVPTDAALHEAKRKKLIDVIQRLPELAADTDLKKQEWERVDAISKELLTILQPAMESGKEASGGTERIEPLINELELLVPLSRSPNSYTDETKAKD
jgi:hypothetical protein